MEAMKNARVPMAGAWLGEPKITIPKWSEHNPVNLITGICTCTGDWGKEAPPVCRSCSVEKGAHVAIQGFSETFLPGEVGRIITCEPNHFGVIPAILSTCFCGMLKRMNIASLQGDVHVNLQ